MSASAGRVMIIPKGEYVSTETYQILDLVKDGSSAYIAKKTSKNVKPSNDTTQTYWMRITEAPESVEAQTVIDSFNAVFDMTSSS